MAFDQIRGQQTAVTVLRQAWSNGRLAHAYLFIGPDGVGKRLAAVTLAKVMNCLSPPAPGEACETCPSCTKINSSNHADVILLEPHGDVLKIDQVRTLQKMLQFHPLEGGRRACIIEAADRLNDAAANALLKTLEEPPDENHFFLLTSRPHALPPTILSRCQWVKFKPLSAAEIANILGAHGLETAQARFYASLAGGSAGRALELSSRVDFQRRLEWLKAFGEVPGKDAEEIFAICERTAKEEDALNDLLDLWKLWVRDLLVCRVEEEEGKGNAGKRFLNHDLRAEVAAAARKYSCAELENLFGVISQVQRSIERKANRQLALETLLLGMKKNMGHK